MATLEKVKERLRTFIADRGIHDDGRLRAMGYLISAEDFFVEAAARVLKTLPYVKWEVEGILQQAETFCHRMPADIMSEQHVVHALPRGHFLVQNSWSTGYHIARSAYGYTSKSIRP